MKKIFTFLCAALMSAGMYATTVTWNSNTLSSINIHNGQSFTQDGVTVTSLDGMIDGRDGSWRGISNDASFKFSTSLGNFTKIEITGDIMVLGGSGWTQTSPGAVWTGEANETTFGMFFRNVSQIVFTIEEPTVAVTGVTLNQNEAQMTVGGETLTLTATVNPNNATDQSVSWSTSDANVATVNNGVVTAVAAGNATITVTTTDGSFTATCAVTVTAPEPAKYYIVGNMTNWDVDENYEMNPNIYADTEEYFYALDLTTTSEFKVMKVEGENQTWYPTGVGNNYGQNGEITEDAEYTIYFRPNYNGGEDWFYNCIYVTKNEPEPAEVTVVFAANDKTAERTVTLPHTFKCDFAYENGELDGIIQELYSLEYGGMCHASYVPEATGNAAVTAGKTGDDNRDHYIQIAEAFEGTATVTGYYRKYNVDYDTEEMTYTLTISIKAGTATAVENVQTNQVQATKFFRDGQLLIERDGKIFNVTGAQVR